MKTNYPKILAVTALALMAMSPALRASETDERIVSAFKMSYVAQTYLSDDAVKAESKDGVVTLSGTVNTQSHKGLAEETALNLPGVRSVDNRLELKAEYPAEKSNEWIAMNIKSALLYHRSVSATKTEVYVEEGIVTLRGEASSEAQKELTTEYADIEGVREIRNEMTVSNISEKPEQTLQEKIDDASITAQVKIALMVHRSTSALKTSVSTQEGVVTVSGTAQNAAEKALVTKLVNDIHGVNSVVNNMVQA